MSPSNRSRRAGFTLVEVMIVVVILGILAATVLPQFSQSARDAKETSTIQNLQMLRHQIQFYKSQHDGVLPAEGTTSAASFVSQLTEKTDLAGVVDAVSGQFGPYILGQMPPNPYKTSREVTVKNGALTASDYDGSGTHGWAYSSSTGDIRANIDPAIKSLVETTKAVNSF
jgi:general secretion pathway protein G